VPVVTGVRGRQLAEVAIVANLPDGNWEHFHVAELFHELGHAVHFVLAAGDPWLELAGFETEEDFAEVPSQLLEEWAWRTDVLSRATRRSDGSGPPAAMLRRLRDVRLLEDPARVQRMICFAALSLEYHACTDPAGELDQVLHRVQDRYAAFPPIPDTRPDLGLLPSRPSTRCTTRTCGRARSPATSMPRSPTIRGGRLRTPSRSWLARRRSRRPSWSTRSSAARAAADLLGAV